MAEPAAVSELIALCGRLPLALCDVAARAVARPGLPLAALAAEMRDARGRLDVLETGEPATSVRMVFSWSRAKLGSLALRMFRLLGIHPGPDITVPAAASLAGLPREQAHLALAELCDEHLLTEYAPGRYCCHDLLRSYAAEEANLRESEADRRAAVHRMLDHYLHAASVASGFLDPDQHRGHVDPAAAGGHAGEDRWAGTGGRVVQRMSSMSCWPSSARPPKAATLRTPGNCPGRRVVLPGRGVLAEAGGGPGVRAGGRRPAPGDLAGLAMARQHLGWLRFLLGDIAGAAHHLNEAMELAGQVGDGRLRALARDSRAYVLLAQDRMLEAMIQARQALGLYRAAGDVQGEARALYAIGWHLIQLGEHQLAVTFSSRALVAYRQSLYAATESGARALA